MEKRVKNLDNMVRFIKQYSAFISNKKEKMSIKDFKFILVDKEYLCAIEPGSERKVYPLLYTNGICIERCFPIMVTAKNKIELIDIQNTCMYKYFGLENLKDVL